MSSLKDLKLARQAAQQHQQMISDLKTLAADIHRCEKIIITLKTELETANAKYPTPRTTRDDVEYLTLLLECAKKKLAWEKQLSSIQKRAPALLETMTASFSDPKNPPAEEIRTEMLATLQSVQAAMERLQSTTPK
jgi:hypothetical protein